MNASAIPLPTARAGSAILVWFASASSLFLIAALFAAGQGNLLRIAIPVAAMIVATVLYLLRPVAYLHFTLWTWFLTPLIRRLVDWRVGFEDHNLVLAAPILVTVVAGITVIRERGAVLANQLAPFYLCIAGIVYGFVVGMVRWRLHSSTGTTPSEMVYSLLDWLAPLLFGFHLFLRWPMYEKHRDAFQRTMFWAVLLLGGYGVFQFLAPLPWDTVWLEHVIADVGATSFGRPEPFQVRIWSTLNSPGVFANALMAGLLFLFSNRIRYRPLAAIPGYIAFLLSLVRTSWLGWLVGLVILAKDSKGGQIRRLLLSLAMLPILVAPLLLSPEISGIVTQRVQTLGSTSHDESYQDRTEEYRVFAQAFAEDPFGEGLSNSDTYLGYTMDSGIVRLLYAFGWVGTLSFLAGIVLIARSILTGIPTDDTFLFTCRATFVAMIMEQLSGNTFIASSGLILWACGGLALSLRQEKILTSPLALQHLERKTLESMAARVTCPHFPHGDFT